MDNVELDDEWWKVWKRRRYILVIMVCLGLVNMYTTRVNLSVAVVAMTGTSEEKPEPEFGWTPQMKGHLLSAFFYGYMVMQIPAGVLLKYIPTHLLYGLGVLGPAALTALIPSFAHHFYALLMFRVMMGMFQAISFPGIMNFLTSWAPASERSRMNVICSSGCFIGSVLVMPISGFVGEKFGWMWIFYVFAVFSLVWCVIWFCCIRSTPDKDRFITKEELDFITRNIGEENKQEKPPIPWTAILTSIPVWAVTTANFAGCWGFYTMLAQLPAFLKDVAGYDLGKNGLVSSLPYITMTIMSWTAGYLADKLLVEGLTVTRTRKYFICISMLVQCGFIIAAAYIVNPVFNIACISLSIGFGAFVFSATEVNCLDMGGKFSPIVGGFSNTFGTLAGIISVIVSGYIVVADKSDVEALKSQWQIIFLITAALYLVGSFVFWLGGNGDLQRWAKNSDRGTKHELEKLSPI